MSAGSGILHSESNDSDTEPVHFVQMWVVPDVSGIAPGYQQHEIDGDLLGRGLMTIASGIPGHDAPIAIHNRCAALHGARLQAGDGVELPPALYLHVFVARGRLELEGMSDVADLADGDAARFTAARGGRVTAVDASEILIWEMHAALGG
jgi:redox-sensitive bicupin YhaK (pirin superfamily)